MLTGQDFNKGKSTKHLNVPSIVHAISWKYIDKKKAGSQNSGEQTCCHGITKLFRPAHLFKSYFFLLIFVWICTEPIIDIGIYINNMYKKYLFMQNKLKYALIKQQHFKSFVL